MNSTERDQAATTEQHDDEQEQAPLPPEPIYDQLHRALQRKPVPTALHVTRNEYDELRADPRSLELVELSSDGATFRGVAIGVDGGVPDLPAPELPAEAVFTDDDQAQDA